MLTTDVGHEGGSICWQYLKRRRSVDIDVVSIAPGDFDSKAIISRFEKAITEKTKVISLSHVISSTGLRMPIAEIVALAKNRGIVCVVDGKPRKKGGGWLNPNFRLTRKTRTNR